MFDHQQPIASWLACCANVIEIIEVNASGMSAILIPFAN